MFGLFNPMSAVTSQLPSVGGGDHDDGDKERDIEEERLRQEAIKEAEEKRRQKHKKMEEERENIRQNIREKYKIEKKQESDEEEEEEDYGPKRALREEDDDPIMKRANEVKALAEQGLSMAKDKCKVS